MAFPGCLHEDYWLIPVYWRFNAEMMILQTKEGGKSEEARMFYKLVAHTGFIPVSASTQAEDSQKSLVVDDMSNVQPSEDVDMYFTPNTSPPSGSNGPLPQVTPSTTQPE